MCVWCVCVLFVHLLEDDLRYLFNPHQVNHGGVQKAMSITSLSRSRSDILRFSAALAAFCSVCCYSLKRL